jgi:hypothetical protein
MVRIIIFLLLIVLLFRINNPKYMIIGIITLLLLTVLLFCAFYSWATLIIVLWFCVFCSEAKRGFTDMMHDPDIMRRNIAITVHFILPLIVILLRVLYLQTPTVFIYLMWGIYLIVIVFILPAAVKRIRITWEPCRIIWFPMFFDRNMSLDEKINTFIISVFVGLLASFLAMSFQTILDKAILSLLSDTIDILSFLS